MAADRPAKFRQSKSDKPLRPRRLCDVQSLWSGTSNGIVALLGDSMRHSLQLVWGMPGTSESDEQCQVQPLKTGGHKIGACTSILHSSFLPAYLSKLT